jgi:hypothetical protein
MTIQLEYQWRNAPTAHVESVFTDRAAAEAYVYQLQTDAVLSPELVNVVYKSAFNPYLNKVDGIAFNVAPFAKLLETNYDTQLRGKERAFWDEGYRFLNNESVSATARQQLSKLSAEDEYIIKTHVKDSFETFGITKSPDDMGQVLQYDLSQGFEQKLRKMLPEYIRNNYVRFTYQKILKGNFHHIHRDHDRPATLFYLLSDPIAETHWYELTPFSKKMFEGKQDHYKSIGPSHMHRQYKAIIEPGRWYLFNNSAYHSVHLLPGYDKINRTTFLIDFLEMPYQQVVDMLTENGVSVHGESI